jgi:meiotically up-regulated gene 157 (Mug157) protein
LPNGTIKSSSKTGMIKTGFRPSDDPNELPYNVPGNGMMASFLNLVSNQVLANVPSNSVYYSTVVSLRKKMEFYAESIMNGIKNFAVVERPDSEGGNVYAYEVDGFGKFRLYDDANLPSLLSLSYLGFVKNTETIYKNTRALVLSKQNVYYF